MKSVTWNGLAKYETKLRRTARQQQGRTAVGIRNPDPPLPACSEQQRGRALAYPNAGDGRVLWRGVGGESGGCRMWRPRAVIRGGLAAAARLARAQKQRAGRARLFLAESNMRRDAVCFFPFASSIARSSSRRRSWRILFRARSPTPLSAAVSGRAGAGRHGQQRRHPISLAWLSASAGPETRDKEASPARPRRRRGEAGQLATISPAP